ncbi:hypothetical protein KAH37_03830 [bacterium]|nr:hypothetical protein [bacterium]
MFRFLPVLLIFSFLSLSALSDAKQISSDDTQKRYVRKVVLGFEALAFEQDMLDVPIKYCDARGKRTNCSWWNIRVKFPLDMSQRLKAGKTFYEWTVTNRFDKVLVQDGKMSLHTRNAVNVQNIGSFPIFKPGVSSNTTFRNDLEHYLNDDLAPVFQKLMVDSAKQRYQELPEKEQATFITTKAKELGMSAGVIRQLMNSAFVFASHVDKINASGTLTYYYVKTMNGGNLPRWDIKFDIPIRVSVYIYRYSPEKQKFISYRVWQAYSGGGTGAFDVQTMTFLPNRAQVTASFKNTYQTAIKAAAINANYQLKKDDNFAIFMPISGVNGSKLKAPFGVIEDIRVDHPFSIRQKIDGKWKVTGYARARKVAVNCKDEQAETTLQRVKGSAEEADLLREYPWTGLFFQLGLGNNALLLSGKNGNADFGGMLGAPGLDLGMAIDMGYATNTSWLSEFYISFFMGGSYGVEGNTTYGNPFNYFGGFGFDKRFYVGAGGFFIGIGTRLAYMGGVSVGANNSLTYGTIDINPRLQFGWSFTPKFELIINAGWNLAFLMHGDADVGLGTTPVTNLYETFSHGLNAGITFSFHLPVVSAMSKMYSKPSKECKKTKTESK